jgi:DNA-binding transcriptional LysR family regulator
MANNTVPGEHIVSHGETIDLNRLRVFVKVADSGSFTAAACALGLRKSSVSKAVMALEAELDTKLLQRTSRSLRLTDAGTELHAVSRVALAAIADVSEATAARGSTPRGRVRVTCPPDFDEVMAAYVARFAERYPDITVELSFSMRNLDLVAEGYDLALRGGSLQDSSLVSHRLIRSELALYAAPSYLERNAAPRTLEALASHRCVGVQTSGGPLQWRLSKNRGRAAVVSPARFVRTDDMRFGVRLAVAGIGIALLPTLTARPHVRGRLLQRVLPAYGIPDVTIRLLSPSRGLEALAVRLFREGLLREPWLRGAPISTATGTTARA